MLWDRSFLKGMGLIWWKTRGNDNRYGSATGSIPQEGMTTGQMTTDHR